VAEVPHASTDYADLDVLLLSLLQWQADADGSLDSHIIII
jgi:hypothetical protein